MVKKIKPIIIIVSLIAITFFGILTAFLFLGQIPLMPRLYPKRAVVIHAVLEEHDGSGRQVRRELHDSDKLEYGESAALWLVIDSFGPQRTHETWRTLYRGEESVLVVYFNVTERPISLIRRRLFQIQTQNIAISTAAFEGIDFPQGVEIYYLHNLHRIQRRINRQSDEYFDAQKTSGTPIWNGLLRVAE